MATKSPIFHHISHPIFVADIGPHFPCEIPPSFIPAIGGDHLRGNGDGQQRGTNDTAQDHLAADGKWDGGVEMIRPFSMIYRDCHSEPWLGQFPKIWKYMERGKVG